MENRWGADDSCPPAGLSFRRLDRSDFPRLLRWFSAPHVAAWWNERLDLSGLEAKYGPGIDGVEPIYVFVVHIGHMPIGWIQWYRWRDFPEHAAQLGADAAAAGIDLAIGEVDMTGRGLGPAVIRAFSTAHIFSHLDVAAIVADPAADNSRSLRAFSKAGFRSTGTVRFPREAADRCVVRCERAW